MIFRSESVEQIQFWAEEEIVTRPVKKGPFVDGYLIDKVEKMNQSGKKDAIKTWSRRSMIIPDFVGHTFEVHNGKSFIPVFVI